MSHCPTHRVRATPAGRLRRASTLVAFAGGLLFFGEVNGRRKLPAVLGVLAGIVLTLVG